MSTFSTRNSDGASGTGEPVSTVPASVARRVAREAEASGCSDTADLWAREKSIGTGDFDPRKAGSN